MALGNDSFKKELSPAQKLEAEVMRVANKWVDRGLQLDKIGHREVIVEEIMVLISKNIGGK